MKNIVHIYINVSTATNRFVLEKIKCETDCGNIYFTLNKI